MERGGGQDPEVPEGGARGAQVGQHRAHHGGRVRHQGQDRQAVQRQVPPLRRRYRSHLDSAIVNTEWTAEEERTLYEMHEEIGNKWSAISQKLPGR